VLVTPSWFGTIVRALVTAGPHSVITGQVRPTAPAASGGFAPSTRIDTVPEVYTGRIGEDVLLPLNMAMYRSAIDEVGGFDERLGPGAPFPGAEDNDLGFRLLERGYRILYVPEAVIFHRAWRSEHEYLPLRWNYGVAEGAFFAKHFSLHDRYMLNRMRSDFVRHIRKIPFHLWRRERRLMLRNAVYCLGLLYGGLRWSITQRRS